MTRGSAVKLIGLALLVLALAAACGGNEGPAPTPTPTATATATATPAPTATPTLPPGVPPGGPPAWPYIFRGHATVAGNPIPAGTPIFARLGSARSPVAETMEGRYLNIIVGPTNVEDLDSKITFHLGDPDGVSVPAKETLNLDSRSQITTFELDLSFPRLP